MYVPGTLIELFVFTECNLFVDDKHMDARVKE